MGLEVRGGGGAWGMNLLLSPPPRPSSLGGRWYPREEIEAAPCMFGGSGCPGVAHLSPESFTPESRGGLGLVLLRVPSVLRVWGL